MKKGIKLGLICLISSLLASCAAPVNQDSPATSTSSEPTSQVITSSPNTETSSSNSDSSTPQDSTSTDTNQPVEKVTLTLNLNDGSSDSPKTTEYNKGDLVNIPDPTYGTPTFPVIYTFEGWVDQKNEKVTMPFVINENTTLTAAWKESRATVTVTLDYDGGVESESSKEIEIGKDFVLPVPTKTGYTFLGWFDGTTKITDENGNSLKPFEGVSAVTFKAHWSAVEVTVTLDYDGGVEGAKTQSLTYGQSFQLPVPTKAGYTFLGWFDGTAKITDENGNSLKPFEGVSAVTFKAHWEQRTVTVTFDYDGGVEGAKTQSIKYGENFTLPTTTKPGYLFIGWFDGNTQITDGSGSGLKAFDKTADVTFKAHWEKETVPVTLTLNPAGGLIGGSTNTVKTEYNQGDSAHLPTPVWSNGYKAFVGWYNGNQKIEGSSLVINTNMTLTAHWEQRTVTVTLDYDGGKGGEASKVIPVGENFTLPVPNKTGYIFNGWYNGNTPITDKEGNGLSAWNLASNTTLKANYTPQKINLNIVINGSIPLPFQPQYDITMDLESVLAGVMNAYDVAVWGWYKDASMSQLVNSFDDLVIDGNNNANVYAKRADGLTIVNGVITKADNTKIPADLDLTNLLYKGKKITGIGDRAFYKCTALKSIIIPSNVVSLGESAFEGCSQLVSATLPEGLTELKRWAFYYCSALKTVKIPTSVKTIGWAAFGECKSLTSIVLPEGLTTLDSFAFSYNTSLTSINLPSTLTSIGENAFNNCTSLMTIFIPKNVVSMGDEVFNGCAKLTINCEIAQPAGTTPTGWSETWNPSKCPVNWGQKA